MDPKSLPSLQRHNNTLIVDGTPNRKPVTVNTDDKTELVSNQKKVALFILGIVERIDFTEHSSVILGRFERAHQADDKLDLTSYGAAERGVSRVHAQIRLQDEQVIVMDLGSSNGTFVSGKRLQPNQPYTLKKGEELVLGRLPIQIIAE